MTTLYTDRASQKGRVLVLACRVGFYSPLFSFLYILNWSCGILFFPLLGHCLFILTPAALMDYWRSIGKLGGLGLAPSTVTHHPLAFIQRGQVLVISGPVSLIPARQPDELRLWQDKTAETHWPDLFAWVSSCSCSCLVNWVSPLVGIDFPFLFIVVVESTAFYWVASSPLKKATSVVSCCQLYWAYRLG